MVTIKNYKQRENSEGEKFNVLVVQGGVTPVKSKDTGRMYFTAKTATVSCTFDEDMCKDLIGTKFPGEIVKIECEPFEFVIPETGEVITLTSRYEYKDEVLEEINQQLIPEEEVI